MLERYSTPRLTVSEMSSDVFEPQQSGVLTELLDGALSVLTPEVVEHLPPYFQGIHTRDQARSWLTCLLADSRLLVVLDVNDALPDNNVSEQVMGFVFLHSDEQRSAHMGYLLKQSAWGRGLGRSY